jgi:RNA polymerase sigma-70 factor, ECF subfamily
MRNLGAQGTISYRYDSLPPTRAGRARLKAVPPPGEPGDNERACLPVINKAVQNYCEYLKVIADRELGADLKAKVDASDVVQDTFLEVFLEYERFEGLPDGEFKALLVRTMLNNVRSFARQYRGSLKREVSREVSVERFRACHGFPLEIAADDSPPSDSLVEQEELQRLRARLERLPERDRQALNWRCLDGCTYREIGKRLGCSPVAARKLWLRVVERLRRDLSDTAG